MKKREIRKIEGLYKRYLKSKSVHETDLSNLISQLKFVTGKDIQHNEFPGDGLGIVAGDSSVSCYMSFQDAYAIIKETGTLTGEEFTYL